MEKTMDKLILNTEIVSMRHATRRARVHVINKLVRETRKLRNKKGTEEQKKKYQRKADRFSEEVLIIKKLKDDEISKFALTNTKALEELISDATVTLETRAFARLANHQQLKLRVNEFRAKYPSWAESLPQLLPQLGAKRKKKGKEKSKKHSVALENNVIKIDSADIINNNDKENSILKKTNGDASCEQGSEEKKKKRKASKEISDVNHNDKTTENRTEQKLHEHTRIGEVKRFTELLNKENSTVDAKEDDIVSDSHVSNEPSKSDPFFLHSDDDGDEMMENDSEREVRKPRNEFNATVRNKYREMGPNRRQRRQQMLGRKSDGHFKSFQHKPAKGLFSRDSESLVALGKKKMKAKEEHNTLQDNGIVHPSWEAKRKQKEQQQAIFAFQGKKIKFDDE